jgi:integrase
MGQITIGKDSKTGNPIRKSVYAKTKREVLLKMNDIKYELAHGLFVDDRNLTVEVWIKTWLEEIKKNSLRASSFKAYESNIENHLLPSIGSLKLRNLKSIHINQMYNDLLRRGNIRTGNGLNARTIRSIHVILSEALSAAVSNGIIRINPCIQVSMPKANPKKINFLSDAEVTIFLDTIKSERLYAAYYLMLTTGMRRGELLGLRNSDIDFELKSISIEQALLNNTVDLDDSGKLLPYMIGLPKTEKSRRTVFLPESAINELRKFSILKKEEQLHAIEYTNEYDLFFTEVNGMPIRPNRFSYQFKRLIRKSGIERNVRLHDLRHTVASYLLNSTDINPKAVQELLGHSTISTTLDIYSHISDERKKETASDLENLVVGSNR